MKKLLVASFLFLSLFVLTGASEASAKKVTFKFAPITINGKQENITFLGMVMPSACTSNANIVTCETDNSGNITNGTGNLYIGGLTTNIGILSVNSSSFDISGAHPVTIWPAHPGEVVICVGPNCLKPQSYNIDFYLSTKQWTQENQTVNVTAKANLVP
jgi:hypothetical protein